MSEEIQKKMKSIMYALTKNAAQYSYREFLENLGITEEDYKEIKKEWADKLGATPYV